MSRSLFSSLPWFLLPFSLLFYRIILGNLLGDILFACCIQFLLQSCILSKTEVLFSSFEISVFCFITCPSHLACGNSILQEGKEDCSASEAVMLSITTPCTPTFYITFKSIVHMNNLCYAV